MLQHSSALAQPFHAQRAEFLFTGERFCLVGAVGGPRPARRMYHDRHPARERPHVSPQVVALHVWQRAIHRFCGHAEDSHRRPNNALDRMTGPRRCGRFDCLEWASHRSAFVFSAFGHARRHIRFSRRAAAAQYPAIQAVQRSLPRRWGQLVVVPSSLKYARRPAYIASSVAEPSGRTEPGADASWWFVFGVSITLAYSRRAGEPECSADTSAIGTGGRWIPRRAPIFRPSIGCPWASLPLRHDGSVPSKSRSIRHLYPAFLRHTRDRQFSPTGYR